MATQMGELISRCWDNVSGSVEPISGGFGAGEGAGDENGCGDVAVACASSLCCIVDILAFVGALDIVYNDIEFSEGLCDENTCF